MSDPWRAMSRSPLDDEAPTDDLVRRERVRLMLDRTRASNLATLPAAMLIGWLLWPHVAHGLVAGWLLAKAAVCAARAGLDHRARHGAYARLPFWGARYELALACDGALFGMMGWVLLPPDLPHLHATMAATLVGIAAIGLSVLSSSWRPSLAFTLPLLLPGTLNLLLADERTATYLGLGMLFFAMLVVKEVRLASAHTGDMLKLRFQTDRLAREREAALVLAQRSDAAKSQFLATMSHEMRTPLHGILGLARELRRETPATAPQARRLETLERAGDHLLSVINDVLDFSSLEARHLRLSEQPFECGALLQGLQSLARVSAEERGLALELQSALPTPCWLRGDSLRLRQVLLNLLGNAIKFTETGSVSLHASASREPGTAEAPLGRLVLRIDVVDSGPGVAPEQRQRIFDAFHQGDGSFGRRQGGTGLGLTISRELARAMGGDLSCLPNAPRGARFRLEVTLPCAAEPALAADEPAGEPAAGPADDPTDERSGEARGEATDAATDAATVSSAAGAPALRVLLAEDNEVNALVARAVLARIGAEVTHASDGSEAVQAVQAVHRARAKPFDVVLMDCQMPGLDGLEATAHIRRLETEQGREPVPIIALTANALEGDRERCLAAGMNDHLSKPFRAEELLELLQRHTKADCRC